MFTYFMLKIPLATVTAPQSCNSLKFKDTSNSSTFFNPYKASTNG